MFESFIYVYGGYYLVDFSYFSIIRSHFSGRLNSLEENI
jgi:hypothetical protein